MCRDLLRLGQSFSLSLSFFFFFFGFFGLHPRPMEVPRLAVGLELQPLAYTTTTAASATYPTALGNVGS